MDKLSQLNPLDLGIKISDELPKSNPTGRSELAKRLQPVRTLGEAEMRTYAFPPPVIQIVFIRIKKGPGKGSKRTVLTKCCLVTTMTNRILGL